MVDFDRVSVHGGHSGAYCGHATDTLGAVVDRYVELGFPWVCLTEHMPPQTRAMIPPEEAAANLGVADLDARFDRYFEEARALQASRAREIEILVGFETEAYDGYEAEVAGLIARHEPDMLVGSVHHLNGYLFDATVDDYRRAVAASGGIEAFYCDYFDRQLELIERFEPAVVGHFDLVRIFDPDYRMRWEVAVVRDRALRNLERIRDLGLVLDLNVRALLKGADEPYLSEPLMAFAIEQAIPIALGDDSHGVANVGAKLADGAAVFAARGGKPEWTKPVRGRHRS